MESNIIKNPNLFSFNNEDYSLADLILQKLRNLIKILNLTNLNQLNTLTKYNLCPLKKSISNMRQIIIANIKEMKSYNDNNLYTNFLEIDYFLFKTNFNFFIKLTDNKLLNPTSNTLLFPFLTKFSNFKMPTPYIQYSLNYFLTIYEKGLISRESALQFYISNISTFNCILHKNILQEYNSKCLHISMAWISIIGYYPYTVRTIDLICSFVQIELNSDDETYADVVLFYFCLKQLKLFRNDNDDETFCITMKNYYFEKLKEVESLTTKNCKREFILYLKLCYYKYVNPIISKNYIKERENEIDEILIDSLIKLNTFIINSSLYVFLSINIIKNKEMLHNKANLSDLAYLFANKYFQLTKNESNVSVNKFIEENSSNDIFIALLLIYEKLENENKQEIELKIEGSFTYKTSIKEVIKRIKHFLIIIKSYQIESTNLELLTLRMFYPVLFPFIEIKSLNKNEQTDYFFILQLVLKILIKDSNLIMILILEMLEKEYYNFKYTVSLLSKICESLLILNKETAYSIIRDILKVLNCLYNITLPYQKKIIENESKEILYIFMQNETFFDLFAPDSFNLFFIIMEKTNHLPEYIWIFYNKIITRIKASLKVDENTISNLDMFDAAMYCHFILKKPKNVFLKENTISYINEIEILEQISCVNKKKFIHESVDRLVILYVSILINRAFKYLSLYSSIDDQQNINKKLHTIKKDNEIDFKFFSKILSHTLSILNDNNSNMLHNNLFFIILYIIYDPVSFETDEGRKTISCLELLFIKTFLIFSEENNLFNPILIPYLFFKNASIQIQKFPEYSHFFETALNEAISNFNHNIHKRQSSLLLISYCIAYGDSEKVLSLIHNELNQILSILGNYSEQKLLYINLGNDIFIQVINTISKYVESSGEEYIDMIEQVINNEKILLKMQTIENENESNLFYFVDEQKTLSSVELLSNSCSFESSIISSKSYGLFDKLIDSLSELSSNTT